MQYHVVNKTLKKKETLIGTWEVVYATEIETGENNWPEDDQKHVVVFKPDSVYVDSHIEYAWSIEGDSIVLDKYNAVYIKKLTKNELIVIYEFFGEIELKLKKTSNNY